MDGRPAGGRDGRRDGLERDRQRPGRDVSIRTGETREKYRDGTRDTYDGRVAAADKRRLPRPSQFPPPPSATLQCHKCASVVPSPPLRRLTPTS